MRQDHMVEGALQAKGQEVGLSKNKSTRRTSFQDTKVLKIITTKENVKRKVTHLINIVVKWSPFI